MSDIIERRIGGNSLGFHGSKQSKNKEGALLHLVESDDLVSYGLIPELIGRLHVITTLDEITKEAMIQILTKPKNALIKQYQKLFTLDEVELNFEPDALNEIAELAIKRKTGARGLRAILEKITLDLMYNLPEFKGYEIVITKECVQDPSTKPLLIKKKKNGKKTA